MFKVMVFCGVVFRVVCGVLVLVFLTLDVGVLLLFSLRCFGGGGGV